jgi:hypothetical protein
MRYVRRLCPHRVIDGTPMKFAKYIEYVDDQDAIAAIRPTHRAYLAGLLERGQLAAAGPFDDGAGAVFVYEAEAWRLRRSSPPRTRTPWAV